jgi:hypothetical protein
MAPQMLLCAGAAGFPVVANIYGLVKTMVGKLKYENPETGDPEVSGLGVILYNSSRTGTAGFSTGESLLLVLSVCNGCWLSSWICLLA